MKALAGRRIGNKERVEVMNELGQAEGERDVGCRDVVEAFLKIELGKPVHAEMKARLPALCEFNDTVFFTAVKCWVNGCEGKNPLMVWTVGLPDDDRTDCVRQWKLRACSVAEFYSCGINNEVKADLDATGGNIARFAPLACKHPEFGCAHKPEPATTRVFGVKHTTQGRDGTIELLDGVHHLVPLAANGVETVWAYIAELK